MVVDQVRGLVEDLVAQRSLDLYDLEMAGRTLRVLVTRESGVDLAAIADLTRALSTELDELDPIAGHYTLEVSSPGLERPLRTAEHFRGAVGEQVVVRTLPAADRAEQRYEGELLAADDECIAIATKAGEQKVAYREIERARTRFEWGPAPKPGSPRSPRKPQQRKKAPQS